MENGSTSVGNEWDLSCAEVGIEETLSGNRDLSIGFSETATVCTHGGSRGATPGGDDGRGKRDLRNTRCGEILPNQEGIGIIRHCVSYFYLGSG